MLFLPHALIEAPGMSPFFVIHGLSCSIAECTCTRFSLHTQVFGEHAPSFHHLSFVWALRND